VTNSIVSFTPDPWLWRLSNRALVDAFCQRLDEVRVDGRDLNANPDTRLEILYAEISRRERAGALASDDWKYDDRRPHPRPTGIVSPAHPKNAGSA
jgi:hypothetical protein